MTTVRISEVDRLRHEFTLVRLQKETFPSDAMVSCEDGYWWLAMDVDSDSPAGFAAMSDVPSWAKTGYISRVGVLYSHRGQGLQRRLMRACERKAKALGWERLISSTFNNPPSANNFIRLGYRCYEPHTRWGWDGTVYWVKEI